MRHQSLKLFFVTLTGNSSAIGLTNDTHLGNIHTTRNTCTAGTHFHVQHGPKDTPVFLPGDGEASSLLLWSLVSLISGCTVQPESTYSCFLKVTGQVLDKHQHYSIMATATISVDLPKSVSTGLTIQIQF